MSAPGSRLARQMRPHLGAGLWGEFVAHANRHYKARWLRAFAPGSGVLRCVGVLDGAPCAHAALVDLRAGAGAGSGTGERGVGAALERLHLDHERPLHATCHRWRAAMPAAPRSWDDGLVWGMRERGPKRTALRVCGFCAVHHLGGWLVELWGFGVSPGNSGGGLALNLIAAGCGSRVCVAVPWCTKVGTLAAEPEWWSRLT